MHFGDVRSFLHGEDPSSTNWERLCVMFEQIEDVVERDQALMYAEQILVKWPDKVRCVMPHWLDDVGLDTESHKPPHPAWWLARSMSLEDFMEEELVALLETPLVERLAVFDGAYWWGVLGFFPIFEALCASSYVRSLEALVLKGCLLNTTGVELLAAASWCNQLRFLDMANNHLNDAALAALFEHEETWQSLEVLCLTGNELTDQAAQHLAVKSLASLRYLAIGQCQLGEASAVVLASAGFERLEHLLLPRNRIGAAGVMALARTEALKHVQSLDLCHNQLGDRGVVALANSPHVASLTHLDLEGNEITDDGALALANSPHLGRLHTLYLAENMIGPKGWKALKRSPLGDAVHESPATEQLPPPVLSRKLSLFERHLEI